AADDASKPGEAADDASKPGEAADDASKPGEAADDASKPAEASSEDKSFTTEDYSEYQPDENETKEKETELGIEDALADEAGVDQDEIQED
ncbi:MAG: hypothetical protein V3S41_01695, partial [Spirochaetia bacterium]